MSWADQGIECYVSKEEKGVLLELPSAEGKKCTCYVSARKSKGLVALYHLSNEQNDDDVYCSSLEEVDEFKEKGYKDKGRVGYVRSHKVSTHTPLFRAYDPVVERHFYTTDVKVIDKNGPTLACDKLENILLEQLAEYLKDEKIFLADDEYFCTTSKTTEVIIKEGKVNDKEYPQPEVGDCDDYAHLLKSAFIVDAWIDKKRSLPYAFGILWGRQPNDHAMNFVVVSEGNGSYEVWIVEPQDGTLHKPSEGMLKEIYLVIC